MISSYRRVFAVIRNLLEQAKDAPDLCDMNLLVGGGIRFSPRNRGDDNYGPVTSEEMDRLAEDFAITICDTKWSPTHERLAKRWDRSFKSWPK